MKTPYGSSQEDAATTHRRKKNQPARRKQVRGPLLQAVLSAEADQRTDNSQYWHRLHAAKFVSEEDAETAESRSAETSKFKSW